jgi:hypothetical protein
MYFAIKYHIEMKEYEIIGLFLCFKPFRIELSIFQIGNRCLFSFSQDSLARFGFIMELFFLKVFRIKIW